MNEELSIMKDGKDIDTLKVETLTDPTIDSKRASRQTTRVPLGRGFSPKVPQGSPVACWSYSVHSVTE